MNEELVSIITPLYNCELYLKACIDSVLSQSYQNWEMLIVDDQSDDRSYEIALKYSDKNKRIRVFQLPINSGSGLARNKAIKESKGRFIAFLDSDDLWHRDKLRIQVNFMLSNGYSFSHTSHGYINESGNKLKKFLKVSLNEINYKDLLKRTEIGCLTAMYDVKILGKLYMPNLRRKQDYALWLLILKSGNTSFPIGKVLAWYRLRKDSATSNKYKLILKHYKFLILNENLNYFKALYYTIFWIYNGIRKYYV